MDANEQESNAMQTESDKPEKFETMSTDDSDENEELNDSSGDEDEANETELKNKCSLLQSSLEESPYLYDNHVELIKSLRELGDLAGLREARRKMSELFPLSEDLWLEWLQDEIGLVSEESGREEVNQLFEKAVKDYLSIPVWLEYVQFSIGGMGADGGIQRIRDVFERALTACGLHLTKGANLWEAYREFENAILAGLLPAPGSVPTKEQEEKFTEQHDKVQTLFKRQLTVPLQDLEETFEEYKDWLQDEPDKNTKQAYNKALIKLEKVKPYEDKLRDAEPPRLAEYQEYIKHEEKEGDPARIQCLYERCVQENCLNSVVWLQYLKYLDHTLRISSVSVSVYERAVRNCPWCVQIWQNYILTLERSGHTFDKVKGVFETALTSGISQGSEIVLLWTTFIDYLRRRIKWEEDDPEPLETFRLSMEKAIEQIDYYGAEGDPNATLRQFWATVEAKHCKNLEKARELWSEIMAAGQANGAALWMEFFRFERLYGDNKHCRKVLQRALNSVTDWPESIVDAYVNFERIEGNLEQYEQAVSRCEAQMERINERREKVESAENTKVKHDKKGLNKGKNKQGKFQQRQQPQNKQQQQKPQKQKSPHQQRQQGEMEEIRPYKRKEKADNTTGTEKDFKMPAPVPARAPRNAPPPGYKGEEPVSDATSVSKSGPPPGYKGGDVNSATQQKLKAPPGYKEPQSGPAPGEQSSVPTGSKRSSDSADGPPGKKAKTDSVLTHIDDSKDNRTVFVSNLSYEVDEEQLKDFFKKCGAIDEIRLIKNFKGRSKGYAYVEFADLLAAANALTYDRTPVEGRPMYVSRYKAKEESNKQDFRYATSLEKNKLFVKNLPSTCTEEALKTLFSQHGEIKDVRLVTYKSGASKGLAYVEFQDEHCAAQAVLKTDGIKIGDHEISVAISNPPARKAPAHQKEETSFVPTLGGGKKETQSRGVARTQVMLMPRAVSKKSQPKNTAVRSETAQGGEKHVEDKSSDSVKDEKTTGLSNSDFRNMLLKK